MQISRKTALRIVENWPKASSLGHAMSLSGIKTKDVRKWNRYRRAAEDIAGVNLESINGQFSTHVDIECPTDLDLSLARKCGDFIVTSHTNNSPVCKKFLVALEKFTSRVEGQLLVVPVRYYNKERVAAKEEISWDSSIYPYVLTKDLNIGRNLVISAHRMRPTVVNPLSGKQALSGTRSAIYGHPQLARESVGTPKNELPKVMMTTGSINQPVYSATNDGGKAAFNHSISAVYIKRVGALFYDIQLQWDGNGFQFLDEYWTSEGPSRSHAEIVHGDSHCDHEIKKVTNSKKRLISRLKPKVQLFHDLHNQTVGSHHATVRERVEQALSGNVSVESEIRLSIDYLERLGGTSKNYIVGSNHNDHLDQWHGSYNVRYDPYNAKFHGWLSSLMYGSDKSALQVCFDEWGCDVEYEFSSRNQRLNIHGIDCSQHGDKGVNGSRGGAPGFAKTMLKTFIGHSHSPRIEKGCWQVGVSTDLMMYANGYSTWSITDGLIYPNGKRALITHINGKTISDYVETIFR